MGARKAIETKVPVRDELFSMRDLEFPELSLCLEQDIPPR